MGLLVLFALATAFVLLATYLVLTRPEPRPPAPFVEFGPPTPLPYPGSASVRVEEVSRDSDVGLFRVDVRYVLTLELVFSVPLHAGTLFENGSATASFNDILSPGFLNVGDVFRIENFPSDDYSLNLVYVPEQRTVASVTLPL